MPTTHLLEIHPNINHPSTPRSPQRSLSLRFPHQDPICPLSSPIQATCPAHLILLDFITRTILGEECRPFSSSLCNDDISTDKWDLGASGVKFYVITHLYYLIFLLRSYQARIHVRSKQNITACQMQ